LNNLVSRSEREAIILSTDILDNDMKMPSLVDKLMDLINGDRKLKALQENQKQILANQKIISHNQNLLFEEIQNQSEKNRKYFQSLAQNNNIFTLYGKEIQVSPK
jgi:hypothetical protein